jgi:hypothetical protein
VVRAGLQDDKVTGWQGKPCHRRHRHRHRHPPRSDEPALWGISTGG